MLRASGEVQGGSMQERCFPGVWLAKKLHMDEHLVMRNDGLVVRSRAVHESSKELSLEIIDKLHSTPHDPTGAMRAERREVEQVRPRDVATAVDDGESLQPRRMWISRAVVEKLGGKAIAAGDPGHKAVGYTSACRAHIEGLVHDDAELRDRLRFARERRPRFLPRGLHREEEQEAAGGRRQSGAAGKAESSD